MPSRASGNVTRIREQTSDLYRFRFLEALVRDIRLAARQLRRTPGFTLITVLILALGVGANTAVFSLFNALVLRPLPVHEPERLVGLRQVMPDGQRPLLRRLPI